MTNVTRNEAITATSAAALTREWAAIVDHYLDAARISRTIWRQIKADPATDPGPEPEAPCPRDFIAAKTQAETAEEAARFIKESRTLGRNAREHFDRIDREAHASPAFQKAQAEYTTAYAKWKKRAIAAAKAQEDLIVLHGLDGAVRHEDFTIKAMDNAGDALVAAPIHSAEDALAVLVAAILRHETLGEPQILTPEMRRRIAPHLPATPKDWQ